jgi:glyoxylase-like metal-dependent hydrolase (beta-lactamase superfamily II)
MRASLLVAALGLAAALGLTTACDRTVMIHRTIAARAGEYLVPEHLQGFALDAHTPRVWSFRDGFDRGLVVKTDEGLVVIDPFSRETATRLKAALSAQFPGVPVRLMIYSHHHLDHVRGGAVLEAREILAHEKCAAAWKDFPVDDIAPPTRTISGDETLNIGGVEIRMLYLGRSHSDTLYAFHLPGERLAYTPDLAFKRAFPPGGMPDYYTPGFLAALKRVDALDFDTFVPSHFDAGTHADYSEFSVFFHDVNARATAEVAARGWPRDAAAGEALFLAIYEPMRERYRDWHGFAEMAMPTLIRQITGAALGY